MTVQQLLAEAEYRLGLAMADPSADDAQVAAACCLVALLKLELARRLPR